MNDFHVRKPKAGQSLWQEKKSSVLPFGLFVRQLSSDKKWPLQKSERFNRKFSPDSNLLICGIPNVGKSSLINLIRSGTLNIKGKPMKVGAKPGITRALQTKIRVSDEPLVFLLDTPGIMMPNIRNIETGKDIFQV